MSGCIIFNQLRIMVAFFIVGLNTVSFAQLPPLVNPDAWILNLSKSDEFNGSTLDTSKWWAIDPCNFTDSIHHGYNWSPSAYFRPQNVSLDSGNLIFTVDFNPDSLNDSVPCIHHHLYRFY